MNRKQYFVVSGICAICFLEILFKAGKILENTEQKLFVEYIKKYNKTYSDDGKEYRMRFENFKVSLRLIDYMNKNSSRNSVYGLNVFSDLSQREFAQKYLRLNRENTRKTTYHKDENFDSLSNASKDDPLNENRLKRSAILPKRVDWREKGIIGPVNNQKTCGACWAFSTIETVEAMNALKRGFSVNLSVQEMIDCAQNGNRGCEGGDSCSLLGWLMTTKTKVTTEKLYPFAYKTEDCRLKPKVGIQILNYSCDSFVGFEEKILEELAFHGPVAAAVNALNWQFYLGGVIQFHCPGGFENLNHAVQIVGYDKTTIVPHYIIRNSWGTEFGDKGYLYIAMGSNTCAQSMVTLSTFQQEQRK